MTWNLADRQRQGEHADYLLAALIARSKGRVKLKGYLSPLAWKICDYLYVIAYGDRHAMAASSVSYHELISQFGHAAGEDELTAAITNLQTTVIQVEQGMDFYSAQVVVTDELSRYRLRFRVPAAIQWCWSKLDAEE